MKCFGRFILGLAGVLVSLTMSAASADDAAIAARQTDNAAAPATKSPVVVEMFLSQACSSCAPAAKLLPDLAARKDVIALSWHVDYWNLLNTKNGRWADPWADPAYTKRQKSYNLALRNRSSVYTPQAVIDGSAEAVGSSGDKIRTLINEAASRKNRAEVETSANDNGVLFRVGRSDSGGNAFLVTFKKHATTPIPRGENAGRTFEEVNIVTGLRPLGVILKRGSELTAEPPAAGEGCALIVQEPKQARIVAAAYCPTSS
jgi:hypothetical protein